MRWLTGLRGLGTRLTCAFAAAVFVAFGSGSIWPRWTQPLVLALHQPLWATMHGLFPSQDSYYLYTFTGFSLDFLVFVAFATLVYLAALYLPTLAFVIWRVTRRALRTPGPFVVYALVGALVGGAVGLACGASLSSDPSHATMRHAVYPCSVIVGWSAAVGRCSIERRRLGVAS
jgi:hypothetical protein